MPPLKSDQSSSDDGPPGLVSDSDPEAAASDSDHPSLPGLQSDDSMASDSDDEDMITPVAVSEPVEIVESAEDIARKARAEKARKEAEKRKKRRERKQQREVEEQEKIDKAGTGAPKIKEVKTKKKIGENEDQRERRYASMALSQRVKVRVQEYLAGWQEQKEAKGFTDKAAVDTVKSKKSETYQAKQVVVPPKFMEVFDQGEWEAVVSKAFVDSWRSFSLDLRSVISDSLLKLVAGDREKVISPEQFKRDHLNQFVVSKV